MTIDAPKKEQITLLRRLWKEVFADTEQFLDNFFALGFSLSRCRCVTEDGTVKAALYWFDCRCGEAKFAYLYAVATAENSRGRGLCRRLMENTHEHLRNSGYAGAILVPASDSLRNMYAGMGYLPGGRVTEFSCAAGQTSIAVQKLNAREFALRRRELLPENAVYQQEEFISLLSSQCGLYGGDGFALAAYVEDGILQAEELLGDRSAAPGILRALDAAEGNFRIPGEEKPFAMYCPLTENCPEPGYYGIAFA